MYFGNKKIRRADQFSLWRGRVSHVRDALKMSNAQLAKNQYILLTRSETKVTRKSPRVGMFPK
jgi:hypothetical protein